MVVKYEDWTCFDENKWSGIKDLKRYNDRGLNYERVGENRA